MIAKLFIWLFNKGCEHKWKVLNHGTAWSGWNGSYKYYDLQCEKCGKVKVFKSL